MYTCLLRVAVGTKGPKSPCICHIVQASNAKLCPWRVAFRTGQKMQKFFCDVRQIRDRALERASSTSTTIVKVVQHKRSMRYGTQHENSKLVCIISQSLHCYDG